jgi:tetratricopeptide (TPR) repeat protein
LVIQKIKNELTGSTGFSRQSWEQAARYALSVGENEQALIWINDAMTGKLISQKMFQNLATKGSILKALGQTEEADKLLEECMSIANTNELNTLGYQLLGQKNYEKAIAAFELNVKNNPTDPNAFDSLEEGYKQAGDKENTIKNLKNSFSEP